MPDELDVKAYVREPNALEAKYDIA